MSDLDLTEAIEAVAVRLYLAHARTADYSNWESLSDERKLPWRAEAGDYIRGAAPLIAAQVRAQIAADIEEASLTAPAPPGKPHPHPAWSGGMADAARIARGDS